MTRILRAGSACAPRRDCETAGLACECASVAFVINPPNSHNRNAAVQKIILCCANPLNQTSINSE
jgi:hypothetical protein